MDPGNCTHDLDFLLNGVARATADIRDANHHLKSENERLEKLLSAVVPELELLRKERAALKAAVRAFVLQSGVLPPSNNVESATFARLPYGILKQIFDYATAEPTYQFDPSILAGSYSPWLQLIRMKRGFPLICRPSFWPGMAVLYGDVVLRRMGQISALAETLRTPDIGPRVGTLIKSIRWESCVVALQCADVIREDMKFIFGQCTQLQSFSYHPHHNFPLRCQPQDGDEFHGFFNPLWFVMMPSSLWDLPLLQSSYASNLRCLDMPVDLGKVEDGAAVLVATHKILSTFNALESLTLGDWPSTLSTSLREELTSIPSVSLPSLTDLQIFEPRGEVNTYLCSSWTAPRLSRLTILISTDWSPIRLLETLGSRLRYLHLYPYTFRYERATIPGVSAYLPTLTSTLSAVCPLLQHLIAPRSLTVARSMVIINSPTLEHVDFWTTECGGKSRQDSARADVYRSWTVDAQSDAPSLRAVRFIITFATDTMLAPTFRSATCNPDWPWICHPRLLAEDSGSSPDALYYRFPLGRVAQTPAAIIPEDLWEKYWEGHDSADSAMAGDWPGVYGDLEEMQRTMDEEREESERRSQEQEARGEEPSSESTDSDWPGTSDDSEEEGDDDDDDGSSEEEEHPDEHAIATRENVEGKGASEELQDRQGLRGSLPGELLQRAEEQEGDASGVTNDGRPASAIGGAAEPVWQGCLPPQLDRATVLAAFRRGRDRESYHHVAPWDQDSESSTT